MATGGLRTNSDDYYRFYKALHLVVHAAIPCVEHCLQDWHQRQKAVLSPCTNPGICPPKRKPKQPVSCQSCVNWGVAIEAALYKQAMITWRNVTSSNLYSSHVEVAKAFIWLLPSNSRISRIEDLDSVNLLKIMLNFEHFHAGDFATYDCILRVSSVTIICIAYQIMLKVHHGKFINLFRAETEG